MDSLAAPPNQSNAGVESQVTDEAQEITKLDAALAKCEELGRAKHSKVWDIISPYPDIMKPVAIAVSCLHTTQVSVEIVFSHLKLVLQENHACMGVDLYEAIPFLRTNKLV